MDHSHSIIFSHGNALIFQRKFFLHTLERRAPDPSEISALDFKEEFARFAFFSVLQTIEIYRPISKLIDTVRLTQIKAAGGLLPYQISCNESLVAL